MDVAAGLCTCYDTNSVAPAAEGVLADTQFDISSSRCVLDLLCLSPVLHS